MVLNHVPDGPGFVVELAASRDAEVFGHRDLHAIDVISVPDRLDNRVVETEVDQVLDRPFAQVMVNSKNGGLRKYRVDCLVQFVRRGGIPSEWLFHDDPRPIRATATP